MLNPIPLTTDGTGPSGAIPVSISGVVDSGPVAIADVTGLQAIITDLTSRLEAVEGTP